MKEPIQARQLGLIGCLTCRLVCEDKRYPQLRCPRCHSPLNSRTRESVHRSWAFLLAALIFYLPANLLPVMHTTALGNGGGDSTILEGVAQFWRSGAWDIAALIFVASVAVPCTKFLVLGLLLVTAQLHSDWARRERAALYRLVETIGYWSMLDVLVVALVAALVQFKALSSARPRVGILFFGFVVILTMLSAISFDPRLTWDDEDSNERDS